MVLALASGILHLASHHPVQLGRQIHNNATEEKECEKIHIIPQSTPMLKDEGFYPHHRVLLVPSPS